MFARKLNPHLERHIHSFLVEGNLDLIYPGLRSYDGSIKPGSTLSIIRRVCKGSKEVTKNWQDKFAELSLLLCDPDFKTFFLKTAEVTGVPFFDIDPRSRNHFPVKDLITPLFESMFSVPNESIIVMLKNVFKECDKWENNQEALPESKDVLEKSRFALRQLYVRLKDYRESLLPTPNSEVVPSLAMFQMQFKYLVVEQIVKLLYKSKTINNHQKIIDDLDTKAIDKPREELPAYASEAKSTYKVIKCSTFCCLLPWLTSAILAGIMMPEGAGRNVVVSFSVTFAIISLAFVCGCFCARSVELGLNQSALQFRHHFFEQLESSNTALNADEKIRAPEQKTSSIPSDDTKLEIIIDEPILLGEHKLVIKNAELRTPLLSNKK